MKGSYTAIIVHLEFTPSTTSFAEGSPKVFDGLAAAMIERRLLVEVEGRVAEAEPPRLALERANAVIAELLERGVSARQLVAVDRGTDARREGPQSIVTFKIVQTRGADNEFRPVDAFDPKENPRPEDAAPGGKDIRTGKNPAVASSATGPVMRRRRPAGPCPGSSPGRSA